MTDTERLILRNQAVIAFALATLVEPLKLRTELYRRADIASGAADGIDVVTRMELDGRRKTSEYAASEHADIVSATLAQKD